MTSQAVAVETSPTPEQVQDAIRKGQAQKAQPESIFKNYEFGTPGTETNGYVMTKLFQISHRAAMAAGEGKALKTEDYSDILKQDYLLFPLYLVGASESAFKDLKITLRQGIRTLQPGDVLRDDVQKTLCEKDVCLYKQDVFAGFYYSDFNPTQLAVLVVEFSGKKHEFRLVLSRYP